MPNLKQTIYSMLVENTGKAMTDSGGENGRHWQQNQGKTLADFEAMPEVKFDRPTEPTDSRDLCPTLSIFHVLTEHAGLELDGLCDEFNALKVTDWDADIYGVSAKGAVWLKRRGFKVRKSWNTYNGESNLSQTLQGTNLYHAPSGTGYLLLQVHGGADVRGGYTDAKLFKRTGEFCNDIDGEFLNIEPTIYGEVDGVPVSTMWDGLHLLSDDGEPVPVRPDSKIILGLE